jgi:hypothetical protein
MESSGSFENFMMNLLEPGVQFKCKNVGSGLREEVGEVAHACANFDYGAFACWRKCMSYGSQCSFVIEKMLAKRFVEPNPMPSKQRA